MARWTINDYNAKIDKTKTVMRLGKNGILYEYILPYGNNFWGVEADPMHYYSDAIDVKSHKSATTKYDNGKRAGDYQPIGNKEHFTFYQLKEMQKRGESEQYIEIIGTIINQFYTNSRRGV